MSLMSPQLEAFLCVVQAGTVHGAASQLRITQTGVTQRIRSLERSLSTTLFTRSRRGMHLTEEGQALLRYCQAAQELEGRALALIRGGGKMAPVHLTLAGPSSLMRSRVVPACLGVIARYAELTMTFLIEDREVCADLLRLGKAHIVFVPPDQVTAEMESRLLKPERYLLVGPFSWKRRPVKEIVVKERVIDFEVRDRMTSLFLEKAGLSRLPRPGRHFLNNSESLIEMFEAELGYGVLTEEVAHPYLESKRLANLCPSVRLEWPQAMAWFARPQMPDYFGSLLKMIR